MTTVVVLWAVMFVGSVVLIVVAERVKLVR